MIFINKVKYYLVMGYILKDILLGDFICNYCRVYINMVLLFSDSLFYGIFIFVVCYCRNVVMCICFCCVFTKYSIISCYVLKYVLKLWELVCIWRSDYFLYDLGNFIERWERVRSGIDNCIFFYDYCYYWI